VWRDKATVFRQKNASCSLLIWNLSVIGLVFPHHWLRLCTSSVAEREGRAMTDLPHFDSYSIPARICLGVAIFGGAVLVAMAITSIYVMQ
jgi:hypothetical protein